MVISQFSSEPERESPGRHAVFSHSLPQTTLPLYTSPTLFPGEGNLSTAPFKTGSSVELLVPWVSCWKWGHICGAFKQSESSPLMKSLHSEDSTSRFTIDSTIPDSWNKQYYKPTPRATFILPIVLSTDCTDRNGHRKTYWEITSINRKTAVQAHVSLWKWTSTLLK